MTERAVIYGDEAPLFDRLRATKTPTEPYFLREGDRSALMASVRRELGAVFNTRSSTPSHLYATRDLTTLDYGIPDLLNFYTQDQQDWSRLAFYLKRAVDAFEPRLKVTQLSVESRANHPIELWVTIEGMLVSRTFLESVSFAANLTPKNHHLVDVQVMPQFVIER